MPFFLGSSARQLERHTPNPLKNSQSFAVRKRQGFCAEHGVSSMGLTAAGAFIVFSLGAAAAFVVTGATIRRGAPYGTAGVSHPEHRPLELVSLEYDRDGDRFIVRGMVRNPATAAVDGLVAAVSVFDRDGQLIGSGDAAVEAPRLAAGAETPFVVIVSGAGDVERYHLSFRAAGGTVPHFDRRARGVLAGLS